MWIFFFFLPSVIGAAWLLAICVLTSIIVTPVVGEIVFCGLVIAAFVRPQAHWLLSYILFSVRTFSLLFLVIWLLFYRGMHLQTGHVLFMIVVCAAVGGAAQLRIRSLRRVGLGIFRSNLEI